ncbi:tRNA glutamyl-Q(34) synthetase GluQRS [Pleionea sediminis]|uniref:tRNA glutamyl-Q(34) synthetase GluQRS n=1 Tax=Pleionea sediminis TaxID=2569479 RepID=UPI0011848CDA|nr:tRNA glutamyl-Q(34) synthetase GluQRS [Pleionea sediminis]
MQPQSPTRTITEPYRGRFAPSPTGPLHFGSLIAALASYLDAKANNGNWLLRIEDLDPPREQPGATNKIIKTLESFGFQWDEAIVYQSQRHQRYHEILNELAAQNATYACYCSRKSIREMGGIYLNHCRAINKISNQPHAIRLKQSSTPLPFEDPVQGKLEQSDQQALEDFVVFRKDDLFAYQLAVVVDDIDQRINCIVRGADLLDSTPKQLRLYQLLNATAPSYLHIPLVLDSSGSKLSKQNYAPAIKPRDASNNLYRALQLLGQNPESQLQSATCEEILAWGVNHWQWERIPKTMNLKNQPLGNEGENHEAED